MTNFLMIIFSSATVFQIVAIATNTSLVCAFRSNSESHHIL